jgi:hypothetical protein
MARGQRLRVEPAGNPGDPLIVELVTPGILHISSHLSLLGFCYAVVCPSGTPRQLERYTIRDWPP